MCRVDKCLKFGNLTKRFFPSKNNECSEKHGKGLTWTFFVTFSISRQLSQFTTNESSIFLSATILILKEMHFWVQRLLFCSQWLLYLDFRSLSKGFLNTTCSKRLFCGTRLPITSAVIRHILCNISTSILKLLFSIFLSSTHRRTEYFISCRVRKSNIWA